MNLLEKTIKICKENDINPARSKGQNFLINEDIYKKIIESANIDKNDLVLEVGPGLGFLTRGLAKEAKRVIAVELDDKLAELLKKNLAEDQINNVEIINKDIIEVLQKTEIEDQKIFKIVANLPYNISSIFLRSIFELKNKPESLTLMLQREVAERIIAKPGKMSLLAVSIQLYAKGDIITSVSGNDFWPAPEVESAVIHLELKRGSTNVDEKKFFRLVKSGFLAKRKMLKNNLAGAYAISQEESEERLVRAGFSSKIRAQELSVEDWKKLLEKF